MEREKVPESEERWSESGEKEGLRVGRVRVEEWEERGGKGSESRLE